MRDQQTRLSTLVLLCLTAAALWGAVQFGRPMIHDHIRLIPALIWTAAAFILLKCLIRLLEHSLAFIEWLSSRTATGKGGTARWARYKDYRKELKHSRKSTAFWGLDHGRKRAALFFDFVSNAMCVAPAGSGKGIYTVVTNALSIKQSKVFVDFKGELACMLKKPLEKRGERVRILNPAHLWRERIAQEDMLNPLDIINDDLMRVNGLRDVMDDLREINTQLLPEPTKGGDENKYFRDGSRNLMGFAQLLECMINGEAATLPDVALLIEDRQALEDNARWIAGVDIDGNPHPQGAFPIHACDWAHHHSQEDLQQFQSLLQARARNILKLMEGADSRTFDSFITGAQQALAPFAFGSLSPAMGRSTFKVDDLKDPQKPMSLFIIADASRPEISGQYIGLMQWVILTQLKRHPNKDTPVYFILDEITNYFIHGLDSLLTWGRSYGLRLLLVFQSIAAFEKKYGKDALETLLSETEIKQFLPHQRSPRTLTLIKNLLGEQSVMATSLSQAPDKKGLQSSQSEAARPLRTEEEIRRMSEGILLVRQHPPICFRPTSYGEITPWRGQVDLNPFHKKPFKKPVKLRL